MDIQSMIDYLKEKETEKGLPYIDCSVWIVPDNPITNCVPKIEVFYRYCHTNELKQCSYVGDGFIHSENHQMLEFMSFIATQNDVDSLKTLIENSDVADLHFVNFFEGQPMVKFFEDLVNNEIEKRKLKIN